MWDLWLLGEAPSPNPHSVFKFNLLVAFAFRVRALPQLLLLSFTQNVDKAAHTTYYGLVGLQHRGQEGAGMVTSHLNEKTKVRCFAHRQRPSDDY